MIIDKILVKKLIGSQFPIWEDLAIYPVEKSGWDNRTFHLGDKMTIRLPSAECYSPQVNKEQTWLPKIRGQISTEIPKPIAKGIPGEGYPWEWSVYAWIDGETISKENVSNKNQLAMDIADFLKEMHKIDTTNGPLAGRDNFYRGGSLSVYDEEARNAIESMKEDLNHLLYAEIWEKALQSKWLNPSVWVHGDMAVGNLLVENGKLSAVIDFGSMGVGDPACDLVMAWTYFSAESRKVFRNAIALDHETWERAMGWALWKALITVNDMTRSTDATNTLNAIIEDYQSTK